MKQWILGVRAESYLLFHSLGFYAALILHTAYMVFSFLYQCTYYRTTDLVAIPDATFLLANSALSNFNLYTFILPLVVVLPLSVSFGADQKSGRVLLAASRMGMPCYMLAKSAATWFGVFTAVALPLLANWALCQGFLPHNHNTCWGAYGFMNYFKVITGTNLVYRTAYPALVLAKLYLASPALYSLVYLFFGAAVAGLLGVFLLSLSPYVHNHPVLLLLPLFALAQVTGVLTECSYAAAMSDPQKLFTNYNLWDYILVFAFKGQNWWWYLSFLADLALISAALQALFVVRCRKGENI